jgi:ubiquinone/menaquinone biosynthesis C-methylase UbiE
MTESGGEYKEIHFKLHEIIWGEGFMSSGGPIAVAAIAGNTEIAGKEVLDIGCGLGGPGVLLASEHGAASVIGIDIQREQVELASALAAREGMAGRVSFQLVEPGPLPFDDASFDVVFSDGVIVQIPDKQSLFEEAYRVLRVGGSFVAGDFLTGVDPESSDLIAEHREKSGLSFHFATPEQTQDLLSSIGFLDVKLHDNTKTLIRILKEEIPRISVNGDLYQKIVEALGKEMADRPVRSWNRMLAMTEGRELMDYHIHATK